MKFISGSKTKWTLRDKAKKRNWLSGADIWAQQPAWASFVSSLSNFITPLAVWLKSCPALKSLVWRHEVLGGSCGRKWFLWMCSREASSYELPGSPEPSLALTRPCPSSSQPAIDPAFDLPSLQLMGEPALQKQCQVGKHLWGQSLNIGMPSPQKVGFWLVLRQTGTSYAAFYQRKTYFFKYFFKPNCDG